MVDGGLRAKECSILSITYKTDKKGIRFDAKIDEILQANELV